MKPTIAGFPTIYDKPLALPQTPFTKEDKEFNQIVRPWRVNLDSIIFSNYGKMCNPFVKFTIGGNYFITIKKDGRGAQMRVPSGFPGETIFTEALNDIDQTPTEFDETNVDIKIERSYFEIMT